jgi:hypothetical protein
MGGIGEETGLKTILEKVLETLLFKARVCKGVWVIRVPYSESENNLSRGLCLKVLSLHIANIYLYMSLFL